MFYAFHPPFIKGNIHQRSCRSRYEVRWEQIQTVGDARKRLDESRRIRMAYLDAWPDDPNLELAYTPYKGPHNCVVQVREVI